MKSPFTLHINPSISNVQLAQSLSHTKGELSVQKEMCKLFGICAALDDDTNEFLLFVVRDLLAQVDDARMKARVAKMPSRGSLRLLLPVRFDEAIDSVGDSIKCHTPRFVGKTVGD